ncbi:hypothetical protein [Pseudomonas asplenii]|uniref:hypothetical protein n=1 Tax=Pseudomonas asplenii TaxID=53407 RepID=UPI00035F4331|nr:hypothetical protein [Pseudomonas fuscovaginae]
MDASEQGSSKFSLNGVSDVVDSLGKLFETVWEKSPTLGSFLLILMTLFPFYAVYTWGKVSKTEKGIDRHLKSIREAQKKQLEAASEGEKS